VKGLFGIAGLLLALAITGLLIKQQLATTKPATPLLQPGVTTGPAGSENAAASAAGDQTRQYRQALEAAIQSKPPVPDDK
jgi:hypothetical protein